MTQQTRDDAIHALAMTLSLLDGKEWLRSPNSIQSEQQGRYLGRARKIIEFVENAMADFSWKHAPPTNSPHDPSK